MNSFFKFLFVIRGYPMKKADDQLKFIHSLSEKDRSAYQMEKAFEIFEFHKANNPHYKTYLGKKSEPKSWQEIPVFTKKDLQVPLDKRLSKGYTRKNVFLNRTSGSSGMPLYFSKDKFAHAISWAVVNHRFSQHGIRYGSDLQARFYGMPLEGPKHYIELLKDFLARRVRFSVNSMSGLAMDKMLHQFKKKPFGYVNGYTSSLVLFAKHAIDKGFSVKSICPSLKVVFPTSEVMDEKDRKVIEQGFGVSVVNEYGAAEVDLIAFDDLDQDWLVNNETLFIELLDENNQPVEPGKEGRIIITSLYNKSMPFIRYEVGDYAVASSKMKGPYTVLNKVTGRTNQIIDLPSGNRAGGLTFYYVAKAALSKGGILTEFLIKQIKKDEFVLEYVAKEEFNENQKRAFNKALDKYLEPGLKTQFIKKELIKRKKSGKLTHFVNMIKE